MDNHPIPQDVTHFQFKLIGDMTVKQFAYLASGILLAVFFFFLPTFFLIKFPLALLCGFIGILLAFIPIEGRPADTMLQHFIKTIFFTPNQYIFQKTKTEIGEFTALFDKPQAIKPIVTLKKMPPTPLQNSAATSTQPYIQPKILSVKVVGGKDDDMQKKEKERQELIKKLGEGKKLEEKTQQPQEKEKKPQEEEPKKENPVQMTQANITEEMHKKLSELEEKLNTTLTQKQDLEKEVLELKKQTTVLQRPLPQQPKQPQTPRVQTVTPAMSQASGLGINITDTPNLIAGIVKDPRGNVLPNILVEVKDQGSNPVRAFKTNALGQFSSATPLANGTYIVSLEDPTGAQRFDTIELEASGQIMLPIEIRSIDAREDLRKELFG